MPREENKFWKRTFGISPFGKGWAGNLHALEAACSLLLQNLNVWEPTFEPQEHQFINSNLMDNFNAIFWLSGHVSKGQRTKRGESKTETHKWKEGI